MKSGQFVRPTAASFLLTENCNLRCTYCFEKHNTKAMSLEVARKGLEYLAENARLDNAQSFSAMLFGGEPTLQLGLVREILSYGIELSNKVNVPFTASMITNATIFNDELKEIIETYGDVCNLSVQLSVDGVKTVQDMYRITPAGNGSFEMVEKNIPLWKEAFKNRPDSLSIHGCCNKFSLPYLLENYKFFREQWGFERIWFMPIHGEEWDANDVTIYDEQLGAITDYILADVKLTKSLKQVDGYAPIDRCLRPDVWASSPCGAGKNFITITAEGDLYPCHHFYFNDPEHATRFGSLTDGIDESIRKIYLDYGREDMSCATDNPDCDAVGCYRCIAENWTQKGNMLSQITGPVCDMAQIERKYQLKTRNSLLSIGLISDPNIQYKQDKHSCSGECGGICGDKNSDTMSLFEDTVMLALTEIIDRLDKIDARINEMDTNGVAEIKSMVSELVNSVKK